MKYCMKCGVLVDETKHRFCPLCQTIILTDEELETLPNHEFISISTTLKKEKESIKKDKLNMSGMTSIIMLLSSIIAIFSLIIVDLSIGFNLNWSIIPIVSIILFLLLVNFPFMKIHKSFYWYLSFDTVILSFYFLFINYFINKEITWSYYVVLSILLFWVYASSILLNRLKDIFRLLINLIATAIFVLLITFGLNHASGFSELAVPINGVVFILSIISYLFIKTYIYNWYVVISTLAINISILCLGIDLLVQKYIHHHFHLGWSYIVLLVLIPLTLFSFYLDNHYKIHQYVIKKFHI